MKTSRRILPFIAVLLFFICFAGWKLAHAQDATTSDETVTDTNIDWNSMSDAEVELKAIEMTTPIPASELPDSGTLWSAQHSPVSLEPWPPLPIGFLNVPAWPLGDNVFVLDDFNVNYTALAQAATRQKVSSIRAMDEEGGDFSPDFSIPTNGLWLQINAVSNGLAYLTLNGTTNGVEYEILSQPALGDGTNIPDWNSEVTFWGSAATNWTATTVAENNRTHLFFSARSLQDSTGSGIPDWWWLKYFGQDTNVDAYADPDGDGWNNLQEFQNGTDPTIFNTPPTPQGVTVVYNVSNNTVAVSWSPSPGPVASYTVNMNGTDYTVSSNTLSYENSASDDDLFSFLPYGDPSIYADFQVQANYTGGSSPLSAQAPLEVDSTGATVIPGSQGLSYLAICPSMLPPGTTAIRLSRIDQYAEENYGDASYDTNLDIQLSAITNNVYVIPAFIKTTPADGYGEDVYEWFWQALTNGTPITMSEGQINFGNPFYDGRVQLKQNLIFLLRAASENNSFQFTEYSTNYFYPAGSGGGYFTSTFTNPTNYAWAGPFQETGDTDGNGYQYFEYYVDEPFDDNERYVNFVFNTANLVGGSGNFSGYLTTGAGVYDGLQLYNPTYQFETPTTNSYLSTNQTRWLYSEWEAAPDNSITYSNNPTFSMASNAKNLFGLPYLSAELAYPTASGLGTTTLSAGGNVTISSTAPSYCQIYPEIAQPKFQTVEYDFWNPAYSGDPAAQTYSTDLTPGMPGFSTTNQSHLFILASGVSSINSLGYISSPGQLVCYAKLAVTNGYSGTYAYLGQYFDQAYEINTNGVVMTNNAGILSPDGFYFPTNPGPAALVTMPDVDTGQRGTDVVYVIKLQLDVNHDGNMDTSFSGPDNTSAETPFNFWVNDNFDRYKFDSDDNTNYEDDLGPADVAYLPTSQQVPDCQYTTNGLAAIPDTRDLEDYARLWTAGISNTMKALPSNYYVQLVLSGDAQLRVFKAFESNGGTNYLSDETTASNQVVNSTSLYVGLLTSNAPLVLGTGTNVSEHYIFCGAQAGSAQVDLQILDPSQNVIGDSTAYLQINDIKQMYERWTVGEEPSQPPKTTPVPAVDNVTTAFLYTPPTSTNTPYILLVHGWNLETWEKDRWAETAFKRLYWQGYQGRFGEFRWPTDNGFYGIPTLLTNIDEADNFDNSEYRAWRSATGLLNLLETLNTNYHGHVYLLAHSMGNVVAGEALRLAGTNQLVNTYVASQAAVVAHTYDTTIPNYSFYIGIISFGPYTPNIYGNWFATNSGAGAGNIISYYNTNDFALSRYHWQFDQLLKPDQDVLENGDRWYYGYDGSPSDPAPWNNFYKQDTNSTTVNFNIVTSLNNRYEVMSYAAQAYTTALGATPGVHHLSDSIDLTRITTPRIWPTDPTGNNYTEHYWHSAEFRGDNELMQGYWSEILGSEAFDLK